jgi:invasion protein IalB
MEGLVGNKLVLVIAGLVLGVVVTLGGFALSRDGNESTATTYGDWKLSCPSRNAASAECTLTQDIMQSGTGMTLVHMQLVGGSSGNQLLIVVPHGVLLQPGLGLVIGRNPMRVLKYKTCDSVGCLTYLPLDSAALDALREDDSGRIVVVWRDGKELAYPCSFRGLTKGIGAYGWASFKRSSWLGILLP